ncbi:hypothetical protein Pla22_34580 [Rubripirellula amarantea]|uniref:HEAT repeat domain-containing protein n=1 Tax=Rubripirellula amarantea TaxID=2527999 RepID=A0A5C5WKQ5_9BACT|nr:HEAT repeat domain-containing protein [Rubripirellula amarantea]TWT50715.1 hypothetical protein Pla22_34580 [Rubripirellula amarantea]
MKRYLAAVLTLSLAATPAIADSLELLGGGHLTGKVVRKGKSVFVAVDDEIQIAVEDARVLRSVNSDELKEYKSLAASVGDDPEAHYKLAIWCATPGNVPGFKQFYTRFHMQRAIELDPNHEAARGYLKYKKDGNKWVRTVDLMRDRGMVRQKGRWEMPEAVALNEVSETTEVSVKTWIRDLSRLLKVIQKGDSTSNRKYAEAVAEMRAIDDPLAAPAISRELMDRRPLPRQAVNPSVRALRRELLTLLIKLDSPVSVQTMVEMGMQETDPDLRERALDALTERGTSSAIATYMATLTDPRSSNELINRAARALQWFPREELAMDYINALVTTHTEVPPAGPELQLGFGNDGGGGMTTGRKKVVIKTTKTNPAVLALVKKVIDEVDYGYDEKKWQAYIAAKKNAYSGDLRRDP